MAENGVNEERWPYIGDDEPGLFVAIGAPNQPDIIDFQTDEMLEDLKTIQQQQIKDASINK